MRSVWAIVVGAGRGGRFGSLKQYEMLGELSVLAESVSVARTVADGVVVVVPPDHLEEDREAFGAVVVAGGSTRSESVRAGLVVVPDDATHIVVHDAARPLASDGLYRAVLAAVDDGADAAMPVIPLADTICDTAGRVVDRSTLRAVQTPQAFRADALRAVHDREPEATDDVSLVRAAGGKVAIVEGSTRNRKITESDDLIAARALWAP